MTPSEHLDRIDAQRPDAPALAGYGGYDVGVLTLDLVAPDRPDVVRAAEDAPIPRYDRPVTTEVWYPARLPNGARPTGTYRVPVAGTAQEVDVVGRAVRDAPPAREDAPYPLVIVSHGYPGSRYLLAHLTETLASRGFVVASIDHADSSYADITTGDPAPFGSTLYNRPLDQLFVLNEMERLSAGDGILSGLVDASRTAIIGFSMGAYGAVNVIGAGLSAAAPDLPFAPPHRLLAEHQAGAEAYEARRDARVVAAIAIAPWGRPSGLWDAAGVAGIDTPVMFMAGSVDDVSGYEDGVRAMFREATGADRYLLTFENANHNAAAPMPAPQVVWQTHGFDHYADAVWDTVRMNNIAQHFANAFLRRHVLGDLDMDRYLDLLPKAADGVWSVDEAGEFTEDHSYWAGFARRTAVGLRFERAAAGESVS